MNFILLTSLVGNTSSSIRNSTVNEMKFTDPFVPPQPYNSSILEPIKSEKSQPKNISETQGHRYKIEESHILTEKESFSNEKEPKNNKLKKLFTLSTKSSHVSSYKYASARPSRPDIKIEKSQVKDTSQTQDYCYKLSDSHAQKPSYSKNMEIVDLTQDDTEDSQVAHHNIKNRRILQERSSTNIGSAYEDPNNLCNKVKQVIAESKKKKRIC